MIIIDASHLMHRQAHIPELRELVDANGNNTGIIYGVIRSINKILKSKGYNEPCIACFDRGIPLFRRELYKEYKPFKRPLEEQGIDINSYYSELNVNPMELSLDDQDFLKQYKFARELLSQKLFPFLGIPSVIADNVEADDFIATWVRTVRDEHNTIISSDKDLLQLVDDNTDFYDPIKDKLIDKETLIKEFDLDNNDITYQREYILRKAIIGDPSDNIPGFNGIGAVSAGRIAKQLTRGVTFDALERPPRTNADAFNTFVESGEEQLVRNYKLMDLSYPQQMDLPIYHKIMASFKTTACTTADEFMANDIAHNYGMFTILEYIPYIIKAQDNLDYLSIVKKYFINY